MPPPKTGKQLKPEQIEKLKTWVLKGAEWEHYGLTFLP